MDESANIASNVSDIIRRRLPLSLFVVLILLLVTLALALGLPSLYRSRAVILIEAQEMPQDLVRTLVTSFADQRIQVISQRVLTNGNLSTIIDKYDLYPEERKSDPLELVLDAMRKDISVTPISAEVADPKAGRSVQATIAFELAYENKSPALAQRVANEIASLFLSENLRQRTESSKETLTFLTIESEKLGKRVADLEGKLAQFKKGNVESLPEMTNLNIELMNRTEGEIRSLDVQTRSLEQQRVYLESELAQQKPTMGLFSETGERILGPSDRLKVLESEFTPLAARYGENHPDVVAKRREIQSLREQSGPPSSNSEILLQLKKARSDLAIAEKKYSDDHPDVKRLRREVSALQQNASNVSSLAIPEAVNARPDNPAYIQLQARLESTITELRGLHSQRAELGTKLVELETRLTSSPEIERQYRGLTRDYEAAQAEYQEVTAKRQDAELASNLETEQKSERFALIEPPVIPEKPSKPNRFAIGLVGFALSVATGVGSGALIERFDDRLYGRMGVLRALGVPPLAIIPRIETAGTKRKQLRSKLTLAIVIAALIFGALLLVHFLFRPIDILFFQIVRALTT